MITNHTQLLNWLIEKYKYRTYLEIGVQSTKQNFDKIKAEYKVGVDPDVKGHKRIYTGTSDEFFNNNHLIIGGVDLIFIDGLHHADQVQRDFENSLKCLNEGGFIILHDTMPDEEQYTTVPRQTKKWFGNVFSFAMNLGRYNGLNFMTFDFDCGITLCWKQRKEIEMPKEIYVNTFDDYLKYRNSALQVGTIEQFESLNIK